MTSNTNIFHCLICTSSSSTVSKVDKGDVLFLLRILLHVPQDSHLFYTIKLKLESVKTCDKCTSSVKQCRQLYREIGQRIEKFWGTQNQILGNISSSSSGTKNRTKKSDHPDTNCEDDNYNNWVDECRRYVKDHQFGGFGYPFVVQDLEALLNSLPPTHSKPPSSPLTVDLTEAPVKKEISVADVDDNADSVNFDDNFDQDLPSPSSSEKLNDTIADLQDNDVHVKVEREPEINQEDDNDNDKDDFGDDEDYSSEKSEDDGSANGGSDEDDDYQPPSKRTRSSLPSKQAKKKDDKKIIKKGDYANSLKRDLKKDSWLSKYKRDPETGKLICEWPDCDKQFASSDAFKCHLDKHNGTPKQNCDQCQEKFYRRAELVNHKELVHGSKEFCCEFCGKKFSCRARLTGHRNDVHLVRGQQVDCEICGRTMKKSYLRLHMRRSHWGTLRRFGCHICPSVYVNEMELKMHLWRIHEFVEREEEKEVILERIERKREAQRGSFKCSVKRCKMSYMKKEGLEKHVEEKHGGRWGVVEDEAGEEFRCEICGKGYHDRRRFNEHRKHHENVERGRWTCGTCGKRCQTKFAYESHLRTHLEEKDKRWRCEVCGRAFGEEKALKKHEESGRHKKKVEEMGGE